MRPVGVASGAAPFYLRDLSLSSPTLTSLKPSPATCLHKELNTSEEKYAAMHRRLPRTSRCCPCGRRHLIGDCAAAWAALLPLVYVKAGNGLALDANGSMEKFRPARPDWYEELFAKAMEEGMRSYEAEVAGYKEDLFRSFTGTSKKVLELGVGTGPNFKYYAHADDLHVVGVDPNKQMEKYARGAALAAGLLPTSFTFMQGVGEDLPVEDGTMDAVIGTLVLCSVKDVNLTLQEVKRVLKVGGQYLFIEHVAAQDGSFLRFTQSILDPLQQFFADGCHLTRETGEQISHAGFSDVNINMTYVPTISIISPHVYGIACK
ncbi:methyltransferase-like protein 7A isoform X1 [Dendrobium catenatum]|nr:methyltransferase-like protein 7A isoform X1 [Dendrobium catenatum]